MPGRGQAWGSPTGWPRERLRAEGGGVPRLGSSDPQWGEAALSFHPRTLDQTDSSSSGIQVWAAWGMGTQMGTPHCPEGGPGLNAEAGVPAWARSLKRAAWLLAVDRPPTPITPALLRLLWGFRTAGLRGQLLGRLYMEGAWEEGWALGYRQGGLSNNTCALGGRKAHFSRCPGPPPAPRLFLPRPASLPSISLCPPRLSFLLSLSLLSSLPLPVSPLTQSVTGQPQPEKTLTSAVFLPHSLGGLS